MLTIDQPQPSYTIRDYVPEDEMRVLELLRAALGESGSVPRTAAFWRWKHFENPFGPSQLLLAENGEVLGIRPFMHWGLRVSSGQLRAVMSVDTSTHPGYRRLGIFSHLTRLSVERARADGIHLVFNTPNPKSMAGYLKLGWEPVGRPRLMIKIINPLRLAAGAINLRRLKLSKPLTPHDVTAFFRSSPRPVEALFDHAQRLERILSFDDEFNSNGIRTDRSLGFLKWRYTAAPSPKYYAHWVGDAPLTYLLIYRPKMRGGLREIAICELLVGYGGSGLQARELVTSLIKTVRADYLLAAASPGTQHWGILRRAGFLPVPEGFGPDFVVRRLNWPHGSPDPARLSSWRLSLGDLEIF